jgi:hypothetical protein
MFLVYLLHTFSPPVPMVNACMLTTGNHFSSLRCLAATKQLADFFPGIILL